MVELNPEQQAMDRIEKLELEIREVRRRVEHAHSAADKQVLNEQIHELEAELKHLQSSRTR
jgi:FtsZ-binding cell division protein ZapB